MWLSDIAMKVSILPSSSSGLNHLEWCDISSTSETRLWLFQCSMFMKSVHSNWDIPQVFRMVSRDGLPSFLGIMLSSSGVSRVFSVRMLSRFSDFRSWVLHAEPVGYESVQVSLRILSFWELTWVPSFLGYLSRLHSSCDIPRNLGTLIPRNYTKNSQISSP